MNKFEIVSRWADKGLELPKRSTAHAAGYDLAVAEDITIPPYEKLQSEMRLLHSGAITLAEMADYTKKTKAKPTLVSTGLKCQIDEGWYLKLLVRSSLPLKHWLILANGEGVIDGDYYNNPDNEGEIFLQLINLSPFPIELKKGDKIGQAIFVPYGLAEGDKYGIGEDRKGGFGSTSDKLYNEFFNINNRIFNIDVKTIEAEPSELPNNPLPITCTTSSNTKDNEDYIITVGPNRFEAYTDYMNNTKSTVESEILDDYYVKYENNFPSAESSIDINLNFTAEDIKNLPNSLV